MMWPWWAWVLFSMFWLLGFEWWALKTDHKTLSRRATDYTEMHAWFPWCAGFILGGVTWGLAVHFFWHWCPALTQRGY
jgi:hypothetical protein